MSVLCKTTIMEVVKSTKGKDLYYYDGYLYRVQKSVRETKYLSCVNRACEARRKLLSGTMTPLQGEHLSPPNPSKKTKRLLKAELVEMAKQTPHHSMKQTYRRGLRSSSPLSLHNEHAMRHHLRVFFSALPLSARTASLHLSESPPLPSCLSTHSIFRRRDIRPS